MLSVLIPTYNDLEFLPMAIASALEIKSVSEIIVIDDCSLDNTKEFLETLCSNNSRVKYFRNESNKGTGISLIRAIEESNFPYVIMLNSDDFYLPNGIKNLFEFMSANELEIAYGKMAIKEEKGIIKFFHPGYKNENYVGDRDEFKDLLIFDMYPPSFGTIYKKEILQEFYKPGYFEKIIEEFGEDLIAHDYDLILNLAKKKKKIGFLNEYVCVWCPKPYSRSNELYYTSGKAAFESSFLFNRYHNGFDFDYETKSNILKRIKGKLEYVDKGVMNKNNHLYKHYDLFLKNIGLNSL